MSGSPIDSDEIVLAISQAERIPDTLPVRHVRLKDDSSQPALIGSNPNLVCCGTIQAYQLLGPALQRVLRTYELIEAVQERAKDQYDGTNEQEDQLRQLWRTLKPDTELSGMVTKQWQEVSPARAR